MVPVDLAEIGADFYAANLHKWLMCPAGVGLCMWRGIGGWTCGH